MITFNLITPEKIAYQDEVDFVSLPTPLGEITILPHHEPLITMLGSGPMKLQKGKEEIFLSCHNGVVKVDKTGITVLADSVEKVDELVEEDIEKAREEAKRIMKEKKVDSIEFAQAVAIMERETAKIRTLRRYRTRNK